MLASRVAGWFLLAAGVVIGMVLAVLARGAPEAVGIAAGIVVASAVLSIRGWRIQVSLDDSYAHVRGLLWNRRLTRTSIEDINDMGWAQWRNPRGSARWTPLTALWAAGALPAFVEHSNRGLAQIRDWADCES